MYEKHGLMSKIGNPLVLAYLRKHLEASNTLLIENALRKKIGIPIVPVGDGRTGRNKNVDCHNLTPVKVTDQTLIDHLITQRRVSGISYRHTIESAVLEVILEEEK